MLFPGHFAPTHPTAKYCSALDRVQYIDKVVHVPVVVSDWRALDRFSVDGRAVEFLQKFWRYSSYGVST